MIENIASHIAHIWASYGVIFEEDEANYCYGLQLLLSSFFNFAIIIGWSIFIREPLAWIPFMLSFVPLRLTAGGFHAKTHWACISAFCMVYAILLLLSLKLPDTIYGICTVIVAYASLSIVFCLSPVAAPNKPLTMLQASKYRRYSILIAGLFIIPATLLQMGILPQHLFYIHFYAGEMSGALSLVAATITMNNTHS